MIKGILHNVRQRFQDPEPVTNERHILLAGKAQRLSFLLGAESEMALQARHQLRQHLRLALEIQRAGVESRDRQEIFDKSFDAVKLLLGQRRKFPQRFRIIRRFLENAVVNAERRQRRFQLVGNIGERILEKSAGVRLIFSVRTKDRCHGVDLVKESVQLPFLIRIDARLHIAGEKRADASDRFVDQARLPAKIPDEQRQEHQRKQDRKPQHRQHSAGVCALHHPQRQHSKERERHKHQGEQRPHAAICKKFHPIPSGFAHL